MNCPSCGNEIYSGEMFCEECGADLRNLQPPVPPPVAPPPPGIVDDVPPVAPPLALVVPPPPPGRVDDVPPVVPPPVAPPPAVFGPRLVIKDGGAVFNLTPGKEIIAGRTDPVDGVFPDIDLTPHDTLTGVSRRHAALHEQGGQWFIRDLNSTNYTVVNRQRLQAGQDFLIESGDEIRFGRLVAVFQAA